MKEETPIGRFDNRMQSNDFQREFLKRHRDTETQSKEILRRAGALLRLLRDWGVGLAFPSSSARKKPKVSIVTLVRGITGSQIGNYGVENR